MYSENVKSHHLCKVNTSGKHFISQRKQKKSYCIACLINWSFHKSEEDSSMQWHGEKDVKCRTPILDYYLCFSFYYSVYNSLG